MIQIKNLNFSYKKSPSLFNDLQLELSAGNIYGLLGQNGAGKSTLLKLISGLIFPKSGDINVLNQKPKDRNPDFLRAIYLVTEEFDLPSVDAETYLKMFSRFYPRFNHEHFQSCSTEFNLPKDQKLNAMSYGQKKKFIISFGLASGCQVLIMDEPTNGLDIPSKSKFRKLLASSIDGNRTFIISTHQVRDVENLIDPIIILDGGKIVFNESHESISNKLLMTKQRQITDDEEVIYSESALGEHHVVKTNKYEEETNLNLELLFNAVIANRTGIEQLFNN